MTKEKETNEKVAEENLENAQAEYGQALETALETGNRTPVKKAAAKVQRAIAKLDNVRGF